MPRTLRTLLLFLGLAAFAVAPALSQRLYQPDQYTEPYRLDLGRDQEQIRREFTIPPEEK